VLKSTLTLNQLLISSKNFRADSNPVKRVVIVDYVINVRSKTLLVKAQAFGQAEQRLYPMNIQFVGVEFSQSPKPGYIQHKDEHGNVVYFKQLTGDNKVQIRCQCKSFYFDYQYWDKKVSALFGPPFPTYTRKTTTYPERNPRHLPGLCKHLRVLVDMLRSRGLLK